MISDLSYRLSLQVAQAIDRVSHSRSTLLPQHLYQMDGFTSPQQRALLNEICDFDDVEYLEVGVFKGASLLSAAYNNHGRFTGIDSNPQCELVSPFRKVAVLKEDIFTVNRSVLGNPNVLFLDANKDASSFLVMLHYLMPVVAQSFVLIIDNWNYKAVRENYRMLEAHWKNEFASFPVASYQLVSASDCDINGWGSGWLVEVRQKGVQTTTTDLEPMQPDDVPLWDIKTRLQKGLTDIDAYIKLHREKK